MRSAASATAVVLTLTLFACGDDGASPQAPSVRVILEADLSSLPSGMTADDAMDGAKEVIARRAQAFGVSDTDVTREGEDRLVAQLAGISPDEARDLIGWTALLEFREPVLNDQEQIECTGADGAKFFVSQQEVQEGPNATTGAKEAQCFGAGGATGTVDWTPALGKDSQGQIRKLTGSFIKPGGAKVMERPPGVLAIEFTAEGGLLFEQITTRLVNYPLGIFLDDELIGAPSVRQAITGGSTVIEGLSLDETKTLQAQINAGALPVPVRVISAEQTN